MIQVVAKFPAFKTEANEGDRPVRIFADKEAIDLALQHEVGTVVPEK